MRGENLLCKKMGCPRSISAERCSSSHPKMVFLVTAVKHQHDAQTRSTMRTRPPKQLPPSQSAVHTKRLLPTESAIHTKQLLLTQSAIDTTLGITMPKGAKVGIYVCTVCGNKYCISPTLGAQSILRKTIRKSTIFY